MTSSRFPKNGVIIDFSIYVTLFGDKTMSKNRSMVAESTTAVFQFLMKGKVLRQGDVGRIAWRANHGRVVPPLTVRSYWHGALENHVDQGRVNKSITKNGTTYRITKSGRRFAHRNQIV